MPAGLNKLGNEGWELVSVNRAEQGPGSTFYFKRTRGHMPMAGMMGTGMPAMGMPGVGGPVMQGGLPAGGRAAGGQQGGGPMMGGGGAGPMRPHADEDFKILRLKHAKAAPTAKLLKELYGERSAMRVASDERTNSVLVAGQDDQLARVEAIVMKLDVEGAEEKAKK